MTALWFWDAPQLHYDFHEAWSEYGQSIAHLWRRAALADYAYYVRAQW